MNRLAGTTIFLLSVTLSIAALSQEKPAATAPAAEEATPGELPVTIDMLGRFAQNYTVTFRKKLNDAQFQIIRHRSAKYPQAEFTVKLDGKTEDGELRIEAFTRKETLNPLGIKVDASELTVTWLETGRKVILTRQVQATIPTYFAQLKTELWENYVKTGDSFKLPGAKEIECKLVKVEPDAAHVEWRDAAGKLRSGKIAKKK